VKMMTFHLLPSAHPARVLLETLFRCSIVIDNEQAFHEAGFEVRVKQSRSLMRVATHPTLAKYIFKVFFVEERQCEREKSRGWKGFATRCRTADRIRKVIQEHGIRHFRVPRKWLFHPPYHPLCELDDQPVILVAEYQDLVSRMENEHAWFNSVTESHLDELYAIIDRAGGVSCRPDNIALTKQGQFSFIDTEYSGETRDYESIVPYLSQRMRNYWSSLIKEAPNNADAGASLKPAAADPNEARRAKRMTRREDR
jgi:hypothetical protein